MRPDPTIDGPMMTQRAADEARKAQEAADRMAEATRAVDIAAGDPWSVNWRIGNVLRRAEARMARRDGGARP